VTNKSPKSTQISKIRLGLTPPIVVFLLAFSTTCGKDQSAHIRVNQLGYELGLPMHGYLMTSASQPETKFVVKNAQGAVSYSGVVDPNLEKWGHYTVYGLEFALSAPGSYTISVIGEINPVTSSAFRVDHRAQLYSAALANALSFYQNQRDGADYIPSSLRTAPAHLNDQMAKVYKTPEFTGREGSRIKGDLVATGAVVDASGGWWDAGDYLKFVETHSTALALMLIGVRDFPSQMGSSSSASNFTAEAKFGLDWLLRMWDDTSSTLYYQVGIGSWNWHYENDHSIWRLAQEDDTYRGTDPRYRYIRNRPVLIAAPAGAKISPNLAGRLAGDFALCFMVYRTSNRAYANQWQRSTFSTWPIRLPLATCSRLLRMISIRRQIGATIWSSVQRSSFLRLAREICRAASLTSIRVSTCKWRQSGQMPTFTAKRTRRTGALWTISPSSNSGGHLEFGAIRRVWQFLKWTLSTTCARNWRARPRRQTRILSGLAIQQVVESTLSKPRGSQRWQANTIS
jgi:hypothetical protein